MHHPCQPSQFPPLVWTVKRSSIRQSLLSCKPFPLVIRIRSKEVQSVLTDRDLWPEPEKRTDTFGRFQTTEKRYMNRARRRADILCLCDWSQLLQRWQHVDRPSDFLDFYQVTFDLLASRNDCVGGMSASSNSPGISLDSRRGKMVSSPR